MLRWTIFRLSIFSLSDNLSLCLTSVRACVNGQYRIRSVLPAPHGGVADAAASLLMYFCLLIGAPLGFVSQSRGRYSRCVEEHILYLDMKSPPMAEPSGDRNL